MSLTIVSHPEIPSRKAVMTSAVEFDGNSFHASLLLFDPPVSTLHVIVRKEPFEEFDRLVCEASGEVSATYGIWSPPAQPVEIVHTGEWNVNHDRSSEGKIKYEISHIITILGCLSPNDTRLSRNRSAIPGCHASWREHEGWDTARLPKPRQEKSGGKDRDSTTLPPDRLVARLLVVRGLAALGLAAPLWPSWHGCTLWNEVPASVTRGIIAALKPDHHRALTTGNSRTLYQIIGPIVYREAADKRKRWLINSQKHRLE
ncbi:LOW QUALITY PROTEIN: hypothetical protein T265_14742 [Opisthorchis viverrini]|uniref:Uncharacterized protein n=1 Tax=Opisthorchis viverrini TaxID=6198 RepID=A0A074Z797_OPIVI|nr:LOW QUALITY PROTEIN: hypothetical protein T265_14742 [Opisthorchis viverrini]KER22973.1 LOW QUALITY PROTEIN: hypothetical protein T265_14742 [Opisthorchis viverrini]